MRMGRQASSSTGSTVPAGNANQTKEDASLRMYGGSSYAGGE